MYLLSIDPGNISSAYCLINSKDYSIIEFALVDNEELLNIINKLNFEYLAIEMVASYGMPVGATVFDTCVWIGRFIEAAIRKGVNYTRIYRLEEKIEICHDTRAKDANIRQALIDRFGEIGTKKNPGWFYGFKKDIWQAYAVGVTYIDKYILK